MTTLLMDDKHQAARAARTELLRRQRVETQLCRLAIDGGCDVVMVVWRGADGRGIHHHHVLEEARQRLAEMPDGTVRVVDGRLRIRR